MQLRAGGEEADLLGGGAGMLCGKVPSFKTSHATEKSDVIVTHKPGKRLILTNKQRQHMNKVAVHLQKQHGSKEPPPINSLNWWSSSFKCLLDRYFSQWLKIRLL